MLAFRFLLCFGTTQTVGRSKKVGTEPAPGFTRPTYRVESCGRHNFWGWGPKVVGHRNFRTPQHLTPTAHPNCPAFGPIANHPHSLTDRHPPAPTATATSTCTAEAWRSWRNRIPSRQWWTCTRKARTLPPPKVFCVLPANTCMNDHGSSLPCFPGYMTTARRQLLGLVPELRHMNTEAEQRAVTGKVLRPWVKDKLETEWPT